MKYLLILILLIVGVIANAQDINIPLTGKLTNSDNGSKIGGATVSLEHNGSNIASTTTSSTGKFNLSGSGPISGKYRLIFKKSGLVTKIIEMDFSDIDLELLPAGNEVSFQPFDIELFEDPADIDFSFLEKEPVAKFFYSDKLYGMDFDKKQANTMKARIDDLINEKLKNEEKREREYQQAMITGEMNMSNGEYEKAVANFEKALMLKPAAPEPAQKLLELDALIQKQKEEQLAKDQADAAYNKLIDEGDALMGSAQYEQAIVKYNAALKMKDEQYPKDQIVEANKRIDQLKKEAENQAKYEAAITAAQGFEGQNKLEDALTKYKEANLLKPSEQLPKTKISELEGKINDLKNAAEIEAKYKQAIKDGDAFFGSKNYEEARKKFVEASGLKKEETYPVQKIEEIDKLLAEQNAEADKLKEIQALMAAGKSAMVKKELETAKSKFEAVLAIDANHVEAKAKLAEVEGLIAERDKNKENDELFAQLKSDGMSLFNAKEYISSRDKLTQALDLKNDPQIRLKLSEIDRILAEEANAAGAKAKYDNLIKEAEGYELSDKLSEAINKYREAGVLMPDEKVPPAKIQELSKKLAERDAASENERKIREFITKGDLHVSKAEYPKAIDEYNEALKIDPNHKEALEKKEQARRLAEEDVAAQEHEMFEKILNTAREKANEKNYDKAFEYIDRAKGLKPDDKRPEELRKEIAAQKKKEEDYAKYMDEGNRLASNKSYENALKQYESAVNVIPTDEAKARVDEMKSLIAANADEAEKERLYKGYMDEGKRFKAGTNYKQALSSFQNALNIKPNDKPAEDEISEIQQILDDLSNAEEAYQTAMSEGDKAMKSTEYLVAKEKFERALQIKPKDPLAAVKLAEAIRLEKERTLTQEEEQYRLLIAKGDETFNAEDWDASKDYFTRATNVRQSDPYPKEKLLEIEAKLNPAVVQSPKLEPLGVPFTGSILDAEALFVNDTRKANSAKGVRVTNMDQDITEAEQDLTTQKTADQRETTSEITEVINDIDASTKQSNEEQQELNTLIELGRRDVDNKERADAQIEYNESLNVGDYVDQVDREVALDYKEDDQIYMDYAKTVKKIGVEQDERMADKSRYETDENGLRDDQLREIQVELGDQASSDSRERYAVGKNVEKVDHKMKQLKISESDKEYGLVKETHVELTKIEMNQDVVFVEDEKKSKEVYSTFQDIDEETFNEEYYRNRKEENAARRNDDILEKKMAKSEAIEAAKEEVQRDKAEVLRKADVKLTTDVQNQVADENDSYIKTNKNIENKVEEAKDATTFGYDRQMESREFAHDAEETAMDENAKYEHGDKDGRTETIDVLGSIEQDLKYNQAMGEKGIQDKGPKLEVIDRAVEVSTDNRNAAEKESVYGTNDAIGDIESEKPKKTVMVNSLGKEYPEGVSQEIFTQYDDSGLVKTVIIRRIVVIDGHADVYVKTKGRSATTYSKNSNPSLEYIWQTETQNPKLERHF